MSLKLPEAFVGLGTRGYALLRHLVVLTCVQPSPHLTGGHPYVDDCCQTPRHLHASYILTHTSYPPWHLPTRPRPRPAFMLTHTTTHPLPCPAAAPVPPRRNYGHEQAAMGVRVDELHNLSPTAPYVPPPVALALQRAWDNGNRLVALLDEGSWKALAELSVQDGQQVGARQTRGNCGRHQGITGTLVPAREGEGRSRWARNAQLHVAGGRAVWQAWDDARGA